MPLIVLLSNRSLIIRCETLQALLPTAWPLEPTSQPQPDIPTTALTRVGFTHLQVRQEGFLSASRVECFRSAGADFGLSISAY
jgi:hypothetical protein